MSNANKVFSRGENLMGMFVQHNVPRAHQRLNPQRCRRQMRTEQKAPQVGEVAMSEANSLG
jgi:hypothetical protein